MEELKNIEQELADMRVDLETAKQYGIDPNTYYGKEVQEEDKENEQETKTSETIKEKDTESPKDSEQPQDIKKERIPKVISERNKLREKVQELEDKIKQYEIDGELTVEDSREYIKSTAQLESLKIRHESVIEQDYNDFYGRFPDAKEYQTQIEEILKTAPQLEREFVYAGLNPVAFVDEAEVAKQRPMKYSTAGQTPASNIREKGIEQMNMTELENEITKAFKDFNL